MKTKNQSIKPVSYWVDAFILGAIVAAALILRCYWQFDHVFVNGDVVFREVDPYLHARLAEVIASNFPHTLSWDYFALYPGGAPTYPPVLAYIVATISWVIGLGHPSMHLVDTVAAWLPPIAAVIVCCLVYLIGKEVFKSRTTGLIAALVLALLPSEFFHRSALGFSDHHILEVLFSTATLLLLILGIHRRNYAWFLGAFACLLVYCFNWIGWPLFVAILIGWSYFYFGRKLLNKKWYWLFVPVAAGLVLIFTIPQLRVMGIAFLSNTFLGFLGTIQEVKPTPIDDFYILYGITGFLAAGGLVVAIKKKLDSLLLVWSIFIIFACIAEKRWGYYAAIPLALYGAYFISWLVSKVKSDWKPYVLTYLVITLILTTMSYSLGIAKRPNDIPFNWYQACVWLRENTPEPFEGPDAYYSLNPGRASYGVFSWWDYGHWIIQIGHRVPVSSNTQQESQYYSFFTCDNETEANKVIEGLNIQYILIDDYMAGPKYYAIHSKVDHPKNEDWQDSLKSSMVYKMYYGEVETWRIKAQFDTVKVFVRR